MLPPDGDHEEAVADFLRLVQSGQPVHGRDVLTRSVAIDACYASAAAGREIVLNGSSGVTAVPAISSRNSGAPA